MNGISVHEKKNIKRTFCAVFTHVVKFEIIWMKIKLLDYEMISIFLKYLVQQKMI